MDATETALEMYARFRKAPPDSSEYTWAVPTPALAVETGSDGLAGDVLDAAQVLQWRDQGWLAVDGIWPAPLISAAAAAAAELYSSPKGTTSRRRDCHSAAPPSPF